ncbi:hypothetical protein HDU86_000099 [Geranomyces michiganensis]|nr:hypothetical protein HDU86_000099 [Geranomyces michiganensis]
MKSITIASCWVLILSCFNALVVSALHPVTGSIGINPVMPDLAQLGPAKVTLNGGQYVAYIEDDGSFIFPDVPAGSHILQVSSNMYSFEQVRIDVTPAGVIASLTHTGASWNKQGPPVLVPLVLQPRGKFDFFVPREGFNFWSLLSNPMLLMSGFSMLLFFFMPKLMSHIPPPEEEANGKDAAPPQDVPQLPTMPDISQNLANWFAPQAKSSTKKY